MKNALERGITHSETYGSLKRYLDSKYLSRGTANNIRIYDNKVYIFSDETLITVLDLPSKYNKSIENIKKKRRVK